MLFILPSIFKSDANRKLSFYILCCGIFFWFTHMAFAANPCSTSSFNAVWSSFLYFLTPREERSVPEPSVHLNDRIRPRRAFAFHFDRFDGGNVLATRWAACGRLWHKRQGASPNVCHVTLFFLFFRRMFEQAVFLFSSQQFELATQSIVHRLTNLLDIYICFFLIHISYDCLNLR